MNVFTYHPKGTCSREMKIYYDGDTLEDIEVVDGCSGNLKGIRALVRGMKLTEVEEKLAGIRCGMKPTSCPDQLSKAIHELLEKEAIQN